LEHGITPGRNPFQNCSYGSTGENRAFRNFADKIILYLAEGRENPALMGEGEASPILMFRGFLLRK